MSVKFVKKNLQGKGISKSTSRWSTSKKSLMSVRFAKKDFQRNPVSNSTSRQSTSNRSLKNVNFSKTYFHLASDYICYTVFPLLTSIPILCIIVSIIPSFFMNNFIEHLDRCYFVEWFCSDGLLYL